MRGRLLQHSSQFNDLTYVVCKAGKFEEFWLDPEEVKRKLAIDRFDYEKMSDLLREVNDAQFGIISLNTNNEWLRDTTKAIPSSQRMPVDAPLIDANNMLLRCLSRLRPIDYAIGKKISNPQYAGKLRREIRNRFALLCGDILQIAQSKEESDEQKWTEINKQETMFNAFLVNKLHAANLTKGCETAEDAEKLLMHYRNLSSVLTPSRPLVTLSYDKVAQVLHRETQYPVTEKTPEQQKDLAQLKKITPYPFEKEKNAHNVRNLATQEADLLFADLIERNDRALPAQTRKTHLVGAKNTFIVKNELIERVYPTQLDDLQYLAQLKAADEEDIFWLARGGSPVYLGSGESHERVQRHTRENFKQIHQAAAKEMQNLSDLELSVITLNTYSPLQQQTKIVEEVWEATRQNDQGPYGSYLPTNHEGTLRLIDVDPDLLPPQQRPVGSHPLQKANRVQVIAELILATWESFKGKLIHFVHCASGQDRTGTVVEKVTRLWLKKRYEKKGFDPSNIDSMRAMGANAAEIASHHLPGSPGMKTYSKADNFFGKGTSFSPEANKQFYRKSADTNKVNHVEDVDFLLFHPAAEYAEFIKLKKNFSDSLKKINQLKLKEKGNKLLKEVDTLDKKFVLSANELTDLCLVLTYANQTLESPQNTENIQRLASLSKHVLGKEAPHWKSVGVALISFALLALIGLVIAIPSGGASLLLTTLGVTGLGVTLGSVATGLTIAGTLSTGICFFAHNCEKGLAKATTKFKDAAVEAFPRPIQ
jgi:hypothetical protein